MIRLQVTNTGIRMDGHASEYRSTDGNIVCAAISALTCTLIIALQSLSGNRIRAETGDGMTVIEWQELSDTGKTLVDNWFLGIAEINRQYNCITYT